MAKGSSFTISSGTYDKVYLFSDGTTTIKNGTFKNLGYIENGNKMTITKGNFDFIGSYDSGLYVENGGKVVLT